MRRRTAARTSGGGRSTESILTAGASEAAFAEEEERLWAARASYKERKDYLHADIWAQLVSANRPGWRPVMGGRMQPALQNFSDLLRLTGVVDDRYPIKGCHVQRPYGARYVRLAVDRMIENLEAMGYGLHAFPNLLDPADVSRIDRLVTPVREQVFTVRRGEIEFALKPTGEPAIYPMFRQWIAEGEPLPLRVCQVGPYFRPRRVPVHLLSSHESAVMVEGHTANATSDEMNEDFNRARYILRKWLAMLLLASVEVVRPSWGNRPVSLTTVGFDVFLPWGKMAQTGVAYLQGQVFSRAFNIVTRAGEPTWQTTFGITERNLFIALLLHADRIGLRIPPAIAPVQVVVIADAPDNSEITAAASRIAEELSQSGLRTQIEVAGREKNVFALWTRRGAPTQLLINQEQAGRRVHLYDRYAATWRPTNEEDLVGEIRRCQVTMAESLMRDQQAVLAKSLRDYSHFADPDGPPIRLSICRERRCVDTLESRREGEVLGWLDGDTGGCEVCGADAPQAVFARRT
jgi:prolyl-tRNA synthetase